MKYIYGIILCIPFVTTRCVNFYRKDYTYIEKNNAFYKVHWDMHGSSWSNAFLTCKDEGALLFYPKTESEWQSVKKLISNMKITPNTTEVYVGFHDDFHVGEYITVDGHSTPFPIFLEEPPISWTPSSTKCIRINTKTDAYTTAPCKLSENESPLLFVCKIIEPRQCMTLDPGYKFIKETNKCYKVSITPKTWDEAVRACFLEGGHLCVIETAREAVDVQSLLQPGEYYIGYRKLESRGNYYSVLGIHIYSMTGDEIRDIYQRPWGSKQNDDCGAVNLYLNILYTLTNKCDMKYKYICEMDALLIEYNN